MTDLLHETFQECIDGRVFHVAERPIAFDDFLDLAVGQDMELVDGVILERPMVQLDHELCEGWIYNILRPYAEKRGLGRVLSSRIMVQIDEYGGRMPDLLFVRQDRMEISQQKAVFGAPDLVIEVVSPGDRAADLRALEADYRRLGVPEIMFVDLNKQLISVRRKRELSYEETKVASGEVVFESMSGLVLRAEWILSEPRPDVYDTLTALLR